LIPSEPADLLLPPFVPLRGAPSMFTEDRLTAFHSTDRPQTVSGSSPSPDFLSQTISSLDHSRSASTSSPHAPQDAFGITVPRPISTASPSQSPLHPLAPRWPLSDVDSVYVSWPPVLSCYSHKFSCN
jgi:hypothetical protein